MDFHRQLIRQTLERYVAGARPCDQRNYSESPKRVAPIGLDLISAPDSGFGARISSTISAVIRLRIKIE